MLSHQDERNDSYFRKLTEGLSDGDQVLFIGFARRNEQERNEIYERDKKYILDQAQADVTCINATHDRIIDQIKQSKAVHITGGETPELIQDVVDYSDFVEGVKGKRVGGSSAGACLLSKFYFLNDQRGVLPGLGVLPIRIRVHSDNPKFGGH
jgi:peptidase E